jgi:cobalt-precorrin-6B (C15)-methyltransferase
MKWICDETFIRGKIPMTKFEIRVLTMALLDIEPGDIFLDVGAGTGSISIQAALLGAEVYAIEREQEGVEHIQQNAENFNANIHLLHGDAPEEIVHVPNFNKCFIGGSKGKLQQITETVHSKLLQGGILVANFIKPENMTKFTEFLKIYEYKNVETRLIQTAVSNHIGMLQGNNPVLMVRAEKS